MICGMKQRIFLSAVLIWSVVNGFAQIGQAGQKVVTGSQWNIGWGQFEAHVKPALIQMTSVHEGEDQACRKERLSISILLHRKNWARIRRSCLRVRRWC